MTHPNLRRASRGSALVMVVVLSVVLTGVVLVVAWTSTTLIQATGCYARQSRAYYVAEGALQRAYWRYKKNSTWRADPNGSPATAALTGTDVVDSATYAWRVTCATAGSNAVLITATATSGMVQASVHVTARANIQVPAYTLGGSGSAPGASFNLKNLTINGSVAFAGGVYATGGNAQINGNITYGTTFVPDHITVTGTATQAPATVPTIDYNMLKSKAQGTGTVYNSSQNNKTFDFTAIPGPNPVIYVQGNVNNPTFIGSGTIVATGNISLRANVGASGTPVNVVAMGDVSNSGGQFTLFGSIYAGGNWNHSATFNITGPVTIAGLDNSGNTASGTMNSGATPWFDPRTTTGGGATLSNYGGPCP